MISCQRHAHPLRVLVLEFTQGWYTIHWWWPQVRGSKRQLAWPTHLQDVALLSQPVALSNIQCVQHLQSNMEQANTVSLGLRHKSSPSSAAPTPVAVLPYNTRSDVRPHTISAIQWLCLHSGQSNLMQAHHMHE